MPVLELPMILPMVMDEKGRISCSQVTDAMHTEATVESNKLHVVMATLCHYQCDSKAS